MLPCWLAWRPEDKAVAVDPRSTHGQPQVGDNQEPRPQCWARLRVTT